jgi:cytochrome c6
MRRLLTLISVSCALALAFLLSGTPAWAADAAHGAQIFSANCAACHMGGGNVVNAEKTLKAEALSAYLVDYESDHQAAIAYQVRQGKNAMPAFLGKLTDDDIADVAAYVDEMAAKGWS